MSSTRVTRLDLAREIMAVLEERGFVARILEEGQGRSKGFKVVSTDASVDEMAFARDTALGVI